MSLTRGSTEFIKVFSGKTLNPGGLNSYNDFPLGEALIRMIIRLNIALTQTTASGAATEGLLIFLKGLSLRTSRGWNLYNNVPGRAIYRLDQMKTGTLPVLDTWATTTATTYRALFNLWFADPLMKRPEDFILDTSMFNRLQLDMNLGVIGDLLSTVGDAAIVVTADCFVERIKGRLPNNIKPKSYTEVFCPTPVNPSSAVEMNIERAENLAVKRILVQAANSATSGQPFSGTPADTTLDTIGIDTDKGELISQLPWLLVNANHKADYKVETRLAGYGSLDFCKDGSMFSSILTGVYSRLRVLWANGTLSTSQISAVVDGFRKVQ